MDWGVEKRKTYEVRKIGRCQAKGFACWAKECISLF